MDEQKRAPYLVHLISVNNPTIWHLQLLIHALSEALHQNIGGLCQDLRGRLVDELGGIGQNALHLVFHDKSVAILVNERKESGHLQATKR